MNRVGTRGIQSRDSRRARNLVLCIVLSAALFGCKKSHENAELVCDREKYIAQSFEFKATDGEGLHAANSPEPIVEGYFEKPYNRDWLEAIGSASITDTIAFIETTGARVYRADPISMKSSWALESARKMPSDIEGEWRRGDRPLSGTACGFLAGLYLPVETRGLPSLRYKGAIVVRADAGRWTLIHEFMHHNFKTQAATRGYDDNVAQSERISLLKAIESLEKNRALTNKQYAQKLSAYFQQLIDVVDSMLVQYQFEEVTIEATLQDQYDKAELRYVSPGSYENGIWYIAQSKKDAVEVYKKLTAIYDRLSLLTSTNGLFEDRFKLDRYLAMRDRRLAQLDEVIAQRQNAKNLDPVVAVSAISFVAPPEELLPCAHAQAARAELNEIADAMVKGSDGI